jgi:hypothetical protein
LKNWAMMCGRLILTPFLQKLNKDQ